MFGEPLRARDIWIAVSMAVLGFTAGYGAYRGIMEAANMVKVPRDSYILKSDLEDEYIRRDVVENAYIPAATVQSEYIRKEECEAQKRSLDAETPPSRNGISAPQPEAGAEEQPSRGGPPNGGQTAQPQVEKEAFRFAADGCTRVGSTVSCSVVVNNLASKSRNLVVWTRYYNPVDFSNIQGKNRTHAIAVDEYGNEYPPKGVEKYRSSVVLNKPLQPDVPVRFQLSYQKVAPEADQLTLILGCTVEERESEVMEVVLREIPIVS